MGLETRLEPHWRVGTFFLYAIFFSTYCLLIVQLRVRKNTMATTGHTAKTSTRGIIMAGS